MHAPSRHHTPSPHPVTTLRHRHSAPTPRTQRSVATPPTGCRGTQVAAAAARQATCAAACSALRRGPRLGRRGPRRRVVGRALRRGPRLPRQRRKGRPDPPRGSGASRASGAEPTGPAGREATAARRRAPRPRTAGQEALQREGASTAAPPRTARRRPARRQWSPCARRWRASGRARGAPARTRAWRAEISMSSQAPSW